MNLRFWRRRPGATAPGYVYVCSDEEWARGRDVLRDCRRTLIERPRRGATHAEVWQGMTPQRVPVGDIRGRYAPVALARGAHLRHIKIEHGGRSE